jgi:hypothetical protein
MIRASQRAKSAIGRRDDLAEVLHDPGEAEAAGAAEPKTSIVGSGDSVGECSSDNEGEAEPEGVVDAPAGSSDSSGPWNGWITRLPVAGAAVSPSSAMPTVPCQATTAKPDGSTDQAATGVFQRDLDPRRGIEQERRGRISMITAARSDSSTVAGRHDRLAQDLRQRLDRRPDLEQGTIR